MTFELLDSISLPGNPEKPNDDAFGAIDRAAVVLDGATGLGDLLMPGQSDAAWIAQFGARRLMAHLSDGSNANDAVRFALEDAEKSFKALRRRPPLEKYETPLASMMLVVDAKGGFDALWYGDCAALVKRPNQMAEVIGEAFAKRAKESQRVAKLAQAKGLTPAAGVNRPEYLAALRAARNTVNSEKGGWAFSPDASAAAHVAKAHTKAQPGTLVLLASDGFLALASDYGRYTADTLLSAAKEKGLKALGEEARAIEETDPDGTKFPRFKKSDDATAVLLKIS
ncbi:MAG: protein phosphatase 2C domain-containing protein [Proteobacteria bacterium]|nr:protein phosphatase 2C domain-containing protein [Pseudomonadota bacterium]